MRLLTRSQIKLMKKFRNTNPSQINLNELISNGDWPIFLYSGVLFDWEIGERTRFLKDVSGTSIDENVKVTADFLLYSFSKLDMFLENARIAMTELFFEDIFSFFEYSFSKMTSRGVTFDGLEFPEEIICSQQEFMISALPTIINFLLNEGVEFYGRPRCSNFVICKTVVSNLLQYVSVYVNVNEVLKGGYSPRSPDFLKDAFDLDYDFMDSILFFMQRFPIEAVTQETYRDLNYTRTFNDDPEFEDLESISRSSGFLKKDSSKDFLRFDFSKSKEFYAELESHNSKKLLESIYGSMDVRFVFEGKIYTLSDLFLVVEKIQGLSRRCVERATSGKYRSRKNLVYIKGKKSLLRDLGLSKCYESLIDLLSVNFLEKKFKDVVSFPFIRHGNACYMLPTVFSKVCLEKLVDKIVSSNEVEVLFHKVGQKGAQFESYLLNAFSKRGFRCAAVKRDERKGVPEIDAIVDFDDKNVLLIEA